MIFNECFDEFIDLALQKQIVTVKLYFTIFYFNLYSIGMGPDYSYGLFLMTGEKYKEFKKKFYGFDQFRKWAKRGNWLMKFIVFPRLRIVIIHGWATKILYIENYMPMPI